MKKGSDAKKSLYYLDRSVTVFVNLISLVFPLIFQGCWVERLQRGRLGGEEQV